MSVTIKTSKLGVKNPVTGNFDGLNIVGDTTTAEMISRLNAEANNIRNLFPPDYAHLVSTTTDQTVIFNDTQKAQARANIDAISGNDFDRLKNATMAQTAEVYGENLYNPLTTQDYLLIDSDGTESFSPMYYCSDYIELPGRPITVKLFTYTGNVAVRMAFYNTSKEFISRVTFNPASNPNGKQYTPDTTAKYMRLCVENENGTTGTSDMFSLMVVAGSVSLTEFIPYYTANDRTARNDIAKLDARTTPIRSSLAMFTKIGICGDSFSSGTIYSTEDVNLGQFYQSAWGAVLGRLYGADVSIFARAGATTETYLTNQYCLPAALAADPQQLYIIALGLNDRTQQVPIGTVDDINEDYTQNPNTYCGNLGRIIDQLKAHAPAAKIVLAKSLYPKTATTNPPSTSVYYTYSSAALEAIAEHYGIPYLETLNDPYMGSDAYVYGQRGNHPTAPLYAGLGREIGALLDELLISEAEYFADFKIE